eukprot:c13532_g2_i1.p1 GENE.c13532_g2_i1~~c13532_g2_i1.p1  ORF type:complete len:109 (-),score=19.92 c13532_g2_i1:5-331(-)
MTGAVFRFQLCVFLNGFFDCFANLEVQPISTSENIWGSHHKMIFCVPPREYKPSERDPFFGHQNSKIFSSAKCSSCSGVRHFSVFRRIPDLCSTNFVPEYSTEKNMCV